MAFGGGFLLCLVFLVILGAIEERTNPTVYASATPTPVVAAATASPRPEPTSTPLPATATPDVSADSFNYDLIMMRLALTAEQGVTELYGQPVLLPIQGVPVIDPSQGMVETKQVLAQVQAAGDALQAPHTVPAGYEAADAEFQAAGKEFVAGAQTYAQSLNDGNTSEVYIVQADFAAAKAHVSLAAQLVGTANARYAPAPTATALARASTGA